MSEYLRASDIRRAVEIFKSQRCVPREMICHPCEAWFWALWTHGRWESFKWLWKFKHLMSDRQILEALAGIIHGQYP